MQRRTLGQIAQVIRSKNAGPFELTLDVMFEQREVYERVKRAGVLTAERIAEIYRVPRSNVLSTHFFDPACAFKATLVRPVASGTVGDSDVFGAQQHAPLLDLEVPWPE
jgi:hypothetical protein